VIEDAFSGGSPLRPRRYRVVEKRREQSIEGARHDV
jgi:hypothetical protein